MSQRAALSGLVWLWLDTPDKANLTDLPCRPGEAVPLQAHGGLTLYFCIFSQARPHFPQKCDHNHGQLWHLRELWGISTSAEPSSHTESRSGAHNCSFQMKNKLKDMATLHFTIFFIFFWFNTFHFNGFLFQQVFNANIVLCARPATNTAKKCKILAALMAPHHLTGISKRSIKSEIAQLGADLAPALSPLILQAALSTPVTTWRPLSVNQLRRDHLVLMGLLQLDPLSIQQWALQRYSPMWQNVTSEN